MENLLKVLKKDEPEWTKHEGAVPLVECAYFGDLFAFFGGNYTMGWRDGFHPVLDQGGKLSDFNYTADPMNISIAMANLVKFVNKDEGYNETDHYKILMKNLNKTEEDVRSLALRLLITYVGNAHQPLHNLERVDKEHPEGDHGGYLFPLESRGYVKNLHDLWQSVFYRMMEPVNLPFDRPGWNIIG